MSSIPSQLDGLLLVNKPADITSHDVVHRVRKVLGQKTVGHTGTLDPMATGLMVLVLGEATKLSDYLVMTDKAYWLKVRLGITTDTMDRTGKILQEVATIPDPEQISAEVIKLQGEFNWPVPLYSATKVDGKKLYEYGRSGETVDLPCKKMVFWGATIEEIVGAEVQLTIRCSKGSFVRTWATQLGTALGVGGIVNELCRLDCGPWSLSRAMTLDELQLRARETPPLEAMGDAFVPMAMALPTWKSLIASQKDARLMANGQVPRDMVNRLIFEQKQAHSQGQAIFVKVINGHGDLLAILAAEPTQGLKIRRVFRGFT